MINNFKEKLLYKFTKKYWKLINQKHGILNNFTVQKGLFKDLKLNKEQYWNSGDLGSKIYGFYEKDVQEIIYKIVKKYKIKQFINIGSADGFFPIGFLRLKLFKNAICFEQNKIGQKSIIQNAITNKVLDKIKVYGEISSNNFKNDLVSKLQKSPSLILCDIEGYEYKLFSLKNLELIKNEFLIIEIHPTSKSNLMKFEKNINCYFNTKEIFSNSNNFRDLQELHNLNDIDRNLLTSEGRSFIGKWLILEPKLIKQN